MTIRIFAMALAALIIALPASARAQDAAALRDASRAVYATCKYATGATSEACACTAGFFGGVLNERQLKVAAWLGRIGVLQQSGATPAQVDAEIAAFFAAGYSQADADEVTAILEFHSARGDAVCAPYASGTSA